MYCIYNILHCIYTRIKPIKSLPGRERNPRVEVHKNKPKKVSLYVCVRIDALHAQAMGTDNCALQR